jgi:Periplasmic copper-binding protein (NosD)
VSRSIASRAQWVLVVGALLAVVSGCAEGVDAETASVRSAFNHPDPAPMRWLAVRRSPSVAYAGPATLRGHVTLRAKVHGATRVVGVTFMLGGRPLGTVTRAPWALGVDAVLLPAGKARLTLAAVDRLGHRTSSAASTVAVLPGGEPVLRVTPRRGFSQALLALSRGSVLVHLGPGRYRVSHIVLGPGARLAGSGPATILMPSAGTSGTLLSTRSNHVRISDLAVQGRWQIDQAISIAGASDVRVQRVGVSGTRVNGIEIWGVHSRDSIQDSTLLGSGVASNGGVFELGSANSSQTSVIRTRISGFRGFGVIFDQRFHGLPTAALHNLALDNRISDIFDPTRQDGTDEGGIWTGGVQAAVIGNAISGTGIDGIETVGSSTDDTIIGNDVRGTPVGLYVEHSTNGSLLAYNRISDVVTGINVEWRHDGGGSNANTFAHNRIAATQVGVFVDVRDDYNSIVANTFVGAHATPITFQGSSENLARNNVACPAGSQPFVVQQSARLPTGDVASARHNRVVDNVRTNSCATS